jgi:hypothetical protein
VSITRVALSMGIGTVLFAALPIGDSSDEMTDVVIDLLIE